MTLKGICCICGIVYREGETIDGKASHGYCPRCKDAEIKRYGLDKKTAGDAPKLHPAATN